MGDKEKEIFEELFKAYNEGEDSLKLKMPEASKIHEFNMAIKALEQKGYISIIKKNMTFAEIELTEIGLEAAME